MTLFKAHTSSIYAPPSSVARGQLLPAEGRQARRFSSPGFSSWHWGSCSGVRCPLLALGISPSQISAHTGFPDGTKFHVAPPDTFLILNTKSPKASPFSPPKKQGRSVRDRSLEFNNSALITAVVVDHYCLLAYNSRFHLKWAFRAAHVCPSQLLHQTFP